MLDRLTAGGRRPDAARIEPGGLVDQLLDEDGLVERLLAEDGLADRLLAEGGLVDKLTAKNGPLRAAGRCRRHPEPADAGAGGAGADDRGAARGRHRAEPGGQPAEQYRRPDPVSGPAARGSRSSSRPVTSQRVIDADE